MAMGSVGGGTKTPSLEKSSKEAFKPAGADDSTAGTSDSSAVLQPGESHSLPDSWVFWTRPPISKAHGYVAYEKTLHPMAKCSTVEEFFAIYKCLKAPSNVPLMTDYHLFKDGIRPIWEDKENKEGGKWVLRLKKGVVDRYWDDILFACIGGQLCDDSTQVNGIVLSVRNGEDVISIWTASTGGKVLKIRYVFFLPHHCYEPTNADPVTRESMKSVLKCPPNTRFDFKSHDESLTQRATIDEQRRERAANNHHGEKRHNNNNNNENQNSRQSQDEQRS